MKNTVSVKSPDDWKIVDETQRGSEVQNFDAWSTGSSKTGFKGALRLESASSKETLGKAGELQKKKKTRSRILLTDKAKPLKESENLARRKVHRRKSRTKPGGGVHEGVTCSVERRLSISFRKDQFGGGLVSGV